MLRTFLKQFQVHTDFWPSEGSYGSVVRAGIKGKEDLFSFLRGAIRT